MTIIKSQIITCRKCSCKFKPSEGPCPNCVKDYDVLLKCFPGNILISDGDKLRLLARWLDKEQIKQDRKIDSPEVQNDLRRIAEYLDQQNDIKEEI